MVKEKFQYICQNCSHRVSQWMGKCSECGQWNSFVEESYEKKNSTIKSLSQGEAKKVTTIQTKKFERIISGIKEFDRVVGSGLVPGSLNLLGGQPGIGKSTILMKVFGELARRNPTSTILYISGEESEAQVAERSRRLGIKSENFYIYHTSGWHDIEKAVKKLKPSFLIIDSIQTTSCELVAASPGSTSQVKAVTYEILKLTKSKNITCFIIGHVTKEGQLAGPKILEHMVDTVIVFEGDQDNQYRLLRSIKNRFGSTHEIGVFQMAQTGLEEVENPGLFFTSENGDGSPGKAFSCVMEGTRPLLVEIQGLVVSNSQGSGKRSTQGLDQSRLAMLVAVIEKYFQIPFSFNDVYLNIVRGMKISSRECDLAIIVSLISSIQNKRIEDNTVFVGEVGLTGDVFPDPFLENKIQEMGHLGLRKVVTSDRYLEKASIPGEIEAIGIKKVRDLSALVF